MTEKRFCICVATTKPTTSVTPGGGGGSITLVCPHTGSILSSLRADGAADSASKSSLGISNVSSFPHRFTSERNTSLILAYGRTKRKDDTYGMLISLRKAPLPPLLHWKCRLPEANLTAGLVVSPCGHFIVGGGDSGTCFVWSSFGGSLLRTVRAHYRAVTVIAWSGCGQYLVTGGGDGMIHAFPLMDLVDIEVTDGSSVKPFCSWSFHHLSVKAIKTLPSGRMATASDDCTVAIIEIFSGSLVTTVKMPHAVHALEFHCGRLFGGAIQGSIYVIDLDKFAAHQTSQLGVQVKRPQVEESHEDAGFGRESSSNDAYMSELHGHSRPITSLALVKEDSSKELLVSGDDSGVVRVWDVESRGCIRMIEPWSHSVHSSAASVGGSKLAQDSKSSNSPVTSIVVIPRGDGDAGRTEPLFSAGKSGKDSKTSSSVASLVKPLHKFGESATNDAEEGSLKMTAVPFLRPVRDETFFETTKRSPPAHTDGVEAKRLRIEQLKNEDHVAAAPHQDNDLVAALEREREEVARLQQQISEAQSTIQRWEKVNSKLLAKFEQASSDNNKS